LGRPVGTKHERSAALIFSVFPPRIGQVRNAPSTYFTHMSEALRVEGQDRVKADESRSGRNDHHLRRACIVVQRSSYRFTLRSTARRGDS